MAVPAAPEAFLKDDVRVHPELDGLGCLGDLVRHALYVSSCMCFQHVCPFGTTTLRLAALCLACVQNRLLATVWHGRLETLRYIESACYGWRAALLIAHHLQA